MRRTASSAAANAFELGAEGAPAGGGNPVVGTLAPDARAERLIELSYDRSVTGQSGSAASPNAPPPFREVTIPRIFQDSKRQGCWLHSARRTVMVDRLRGSAHTLVRRAVCDAQVRST